MSSDRELEIEIWKHALKYQIEERFHTYAWTDEELEKEIQQCYESAKEDLGG